MSVEITLPDGSKTTVKNETGDTEATYQLKAIVQSLLVRVTTLEKILGVSATVK